MIRDITKVKITGAIYDSETELEFFNPSEGNKEKVVKGCLLYGRNGTGKSTIAKAFRKLSGETVVSVSSATVYDKNDQPVHLSTEEKERIFVFDEDYVDKNVRLQNDHLDTIVMLGEAADLTEKIEKAISEKESAKDIFECQELLFKEYNDIRNIKSPKFQLNLISNALRGDDNWAGRDRIINNGRQNTGVRDDTYKRFIKLKPSKQKAELIADYMSKIKELEDARSGVSTIERKVPQIMDDYKKFDDQMLLNLLSEMIEKPELSERERKLFELLEEGNGSELSERLSYFSSIETLECPYCFQPMTLEYKKSIVKSIETVLNKKVEDHQAKLLSLRLNPVSLDLESFSKLDGYQQCVDMIEKINTSIEQYNGLIKKKVDNPYGPIVVIDQGLQIMANQLDDMLMDLEKSRVDYNSLTKRTAPLVDELNQINSEITYYDVANLVIQYEEQQREFDVAERKLSDLKENYIIKSKEVDALEAQRSNVQLAIDAINACLKYIFFTENRLKIIYDDGVYKLLSHGKSVKPCDVSVGERNIIGLSYFFTSIFEGKEEKDVYGEDYLLVIDDPVSSYDVENRIGILSFLKYKLSMFLEGNINTKALIMTHDLKTLYDIHHLFEEIIDVCKTKGYGNTPKFSCFELSEQKLKQFTYKKRQEYTELVELIYNYAIGQDNTHELVIGNIMRQVLEAFATFEYKKGIAEISNDDQILALLPEVEYRSYYKNLMYRLVLHGGSHKEEQVKTMSDLHFFSLISDEEKRRTAKDILCFIYLLNKRHLLEHLKNFGNVDSEFTSWCQDVKIRSAII